MKDNKHTFLFLASIIVIAIAILSSVLEISNVRNIVVEVTDKGIKTKDDDSKYLIYTKDENNDVHVFEITDNLILGKFNSSDIYAAIEIGRKYKFTTRGYRSPLFSWYPNIYKYELID